LCRIFSEGLSVINPYDHTVSIELGRPYQTAEGRFVTRLNLKAHSEITLLRP
jgi:hypothetical protein